METDYDRELAHNLREMIVRLKRSLRKRVSNPGQLSVAEESVVRILMEQEESLPSELCAQLNISSQFMSQVLNHLEVLEYISRKASKTDKRKSLISLSKKGLLKIEQKRKQKEDFLASIISQKFTRQEKEEVARGIQLLARLYEDK